VNTRRPIRNRVIFLLSIKAGLRAKEIASLKRAMVTDAQGNLADSIHLTDTASKGHSGRVIPLNGELKAALAALKAETSSRPRLSAYVVSTERADRTECAEWLPVRRPASSHLEFLIKPHGYRDRRPSAGSGTTCSALESTAAGHSVAFRNRRDGS
jgi:integrase